MILSGTDIKDVNHELLIRSVEQNDIEQLKELFEILNPEYSPSTSDLKQMLNQQLLNNEATKVIVGELEGKIVSSCQLVLFDTLARAPFRRGIIESIIVHPRYRSQGIGSVMLKSVLTYLKQENCCKVSLISGYHREGAHSFYKNLGFYDYGTGFVIDLF